MILTHGGNSISKGGGFPSSAMIDGREYKVTKIGNKLWTCSNYIPSWEPVNTGYTEYCRWQGGNALNPSSEIRAKGIFIKHANSIGLGNFVKSYLSDGWRVPTMEDYTSLLNAIGGRDNGYKLLSVDAIGYDSLTLTDEYGFNLFNYGIGSPKYPFTGNYEWKSDGGNYAYFMINIEWIADSDNYYPYIAFIDRDQGYEGKLSYSREQTYSLYYEAYYPIRLVKDAT